jgi:hypothetical protein
MPGTGSTTTTENSSIMLVVNTKAGNRNIGTLEGPR